MVLWSLVWFMIMFLMWIVVMLWLMLVMLLVVLLIVMLMLLLMIIGMYVTPCALASNPSRRILQVIFLYKQFCRKTNTNRSRKTCASSTQSA